MANFSPGRKVSVSRLSDGVFTETKRRKRKTCAEIHHVIKTNFQPEGRAGMAEIRHVINFKAGRLV